MYVALDGISLKIPTFGVKWRSVHHFLYPIVYILWPPLHYVLDELLSVFHVYIWCSMDGWLDKGYGADGVGIFVLYLIDNRDNCLLEQRGEGIVFVFYIE